MQLIKGYKNIWKKKIPFVDRLLFSIVILIITGTYFIKRTINDPLFLEEHKWSILIMITVILLTACTKVPGSWIVKLWLMISSTIGKIIFSVLLFLVYFLVISPIFIMVNLFRRSKVKARTNWKEPMLNKDYLNMG